MKLKKSFHCLLTASSMNRYAFRLETHTDRQRIAAISIVKFPNSNPAGHQTALLLHRNLDDRWHTSGVRVHTLLRTHSFDWGTAGYIRGSIVIYGHHPTKQCE